VGALTLPANGSVYVDAQIFIYGVEKHPVYEPVLQTLWQGVSSGTFEIVTSELTLLEVLTGPLKKNDSVLASDYEQFLKLDGIRTVPISQAILREAARIRATSNLRTPDAIHAATAVASGCSVLITNDAAFKNFTAIPTQFLNQ